jgi:CHASE2 domain-containing sensor protein
MKFIKKIFTDEAYCWFPFLLGYTVLICGTFEPKHSFNPIVLFLVMMGIGFLLGCLSMFVRHKFREKFKLKYIIIYFIACMIMNTDMYIYSYVGVIGVISMFTLTVVELCIFPTYLFGLLFRGGEFFRNYIR